MAHLPPCQDGKHHSLCCMLRYLQPCPKSRVLLPELRNSRTWLLLSSAGTQAESFCQKCGYLIFQNSRTLWMLGLLHAKLLSEYRKDGTKDTLRRRRTREERACQNFLPGKNKRRRPFATTPSSTSRLGQPLGQSLLVAWMTLTVSTSRCTYSNFKN